MNNTTQHPKTFEEALKTAYRAVTGTEKIDAYFFDINEEPWKYVVSSTQIAPKWKFEIAFELENNLDSKSLCSAKLVVIKQGKIAYTYSAIGDVDHTALLKFIWKLISIKRDEDYDLRREERSRLESDFLSFVKESDNG